MSEWAEKQVSLLKSKSPLSQPHPDAGVLTNLAPLSLGGLFRGTVEEVDAKAFAFRVRKHGKSEPLLTGLLGYSYCNSQTASGILAFPLKGSVVIFQEVAYCGKSYANILCFITGDIVSVEKSLVIPQNPGFQTFTDEFGKPPLDTNDQGFEPGDMGIFGAQGNKVKVFHDKSVLVKCSPYNFAYMLPTDNKLYQWNVNKMLRSPGGYEGDFNLVTTKSESDGSFHYAVRQHFVNPVEQSIAIQEEFGLVDKNLTAVSGNFNDVPNSQVARPFAIQAILQNSLPVVGRDGKTVKAYQILQGYSVYKRKVFDFGGRALDKKPETQEYFCEEIKADGAYRVRVGAKSNTTNVAPQAVEVYYKPDGTWQVGSQFGKIQVTPTDMILSTSKYEISINALFDTLMNHKHKFIDVITLAAPLPGASAALTAGAFPVVGTLTVEADTNAAKPSSTISNNSIEGLGTSFVPKESIVPNPNLAWTT